jgi:hypothetical protein
VCCTPMTTNLMMSLIIAGSSRGLGVTQGVLLQGPVVGKEELVQGQGQALRRLGAAGRDCAGTRWPGTAARGR